MKPLRDVSFLVIHTVGVAGDTTMAAIRRFHVNDLGWSDAGYHYGIRKDGALEMGRDDTYQGAHVAGLNDRSIGICVYGHGDVEPHTPDQRRTLLNVCHALMKAHTVPVEHVIGHREAYDIDGVPRGSKTCPGLLIDMDEIRAQLSVPHALPDGPDPRDVPLAGEFGPDLYRDPDLPERVDRNRKGD